MGNRKKSLPASFKLGGLVIDRRRPTLPRGFPRSTIGAEELNFRVRDGNGCDLFAMATEIFCDMLMVMTIGWQGIAFGVVVCVYKRIWLSLTAH